MLIGNIKIKQYSLFILIFFTKGVAAKKHKEGSVHKLLMLLAVPKIQELYYNMQVLLGELGLESLDFSVTSDIKMGNIYKVTKNIKYMSTFFSSDYAGQGFRSMPACLSLL